MILAASTRPANEPEFLVCVDSKGVATIEPFTLALSQDSESQPSDRMEAANASEYP